MKIEELYPTDEEIRGVKRQAYRPESRLSPAAFEMFGRDKCVAKFAVDNAVKKIAEYLEKHGQRIRVRDNIGDYDKPYYCWAIKELKWQALKELVKDG